MTPSAIFTKLVEMTEYELAFKGRGEYSIAQHCLLNNKEIPDRYLPGRLITLLSAEERHILSRLRSEMTFHRNDLVKTASEPRAMNNLEQLKEKWRQTWQSRC